MDTESKILEDIAKKLKDHTDVSGKIKLYTDYKPCPSCQSVIKQFREKYRNIEVEVIYKYKN